MILLEVAVAAPLFQTLTYRLPESLAFHRGAEGADGTGHQVLVPLAGRLVSGYVLGPVDEGEIDFAVKDVRQCLSEQPLFPASMVPFFRWVADYYQFPVGEVIGIALPAGLKKRSGKNIVRTATGSDLLASAAELRLSDGEPPPWITALAEGKKLSQTQSRQVLAAREDAKAAELLRQAGVITIADELRRQGPGAKRETCYEAVIDLPPAPQEPAASGATLEAFRRALEAVGTGSYSLSESKAIHAFARLAEKYQGVVPRKEILKEYAAAGKALKSLVAKQVLKQLEKRLYRNPLGEVPVAQPPPEQLTVEQEKAVAAISQSLEQEGFAAHLLHGVTGSGKTEVYLRAAERALGAGKGVLVLVPEIALATQIEAHFLSRFGKTVALLHSGLTPGQRYDQWSLIAQGRARVVIGARSAVFAPLADIGLVVVDEEHDGGFKQDDSLRYNGRDLAVLRAKLEGATVVLGSATPSVTSYHNALSGKYNLLRLTERAGGSLLPQVTIVDIGKNSRVSRQGLFTDVFLTELQAALERGEQSLVLINRRGFSASFICQECGTAVQCRHCNVALTYHKNTRTLACHYCGYRVSSKLICANCHSETLVPMGVGTERVEEELGAAFPQARIARLDSDSAADRKQFLALLRAMRDREIDILIGTQMIAKGHHFPSVTFVGVVWADGGLSMPDFRAAERTYQLLSQVTGRAGRGRAEGRVVIQTMRPDHYAVELARNHCFEQFYEREIAIRQRPAFPPFTRLACYRIDGVDEYDVRKSAERLARFCRSFADGEAIRPEVLGPATSPLEKIRDRFRWQLLIKAPKIDIFRRLGRRVQEKRAELAVGKTRIILDIDPENMM